MVEALLRVLTVLTRLLLPAQGFDGESGEEESDADMGSGYGTGEEGAYVNSEDASGDDEDDSDDDEEEDEDDSDEDMSAGDGDEDGEESDGPRSLVSGSEGSLSEVSSWLIHQACESSAGRVMISFQPVIIKRSVFAGSGVPAYAQC